MKVSKVFCQSPRTQTYADVVAAIAEEHPNIESIQFLFFDGPMKEDLINNIQRKLAELSDIPAYARGARLRLTCVETSLDSVDTLQGCILVDVTGIAKDAAIQICALAIEYSRLKVGLLRWIGRLREGENPHVGIDNYMYEDLLSKGAIGNLLKKYIGKKHVIRSFGAIFGVLAIVGIAKIIWPQFFIPDYIVNLFSLLIGAAGLYLAAVSLRSF